MKNRIVKKLFSLALCAGLSLSALIGAALAEADAQAIDLNATSGQLVIDAAGTYVLSGTLEGSVLVDPGEGDVVLVLDGAAIQSPDTAGIAAVSGSSLTVTLAKGSENTVSDGGSDEEYDAAIYSAVPLTFDGAGALTVNGNNQEGISTEDADMTFNGGSYTVLSQDDGINAGGDEGGLITFNGGDFTINALGDGIDSNAAAVFNGGSIYVVGSAAGGDAGIDTDEGYTITGGSVIAIGTDMIETPQSATTQTTLAISLDETVSEGSAVALADAEGNTVAEFIALQDFRTLIVSNDALAEGSYRLLVNGEAVTVGEADTVEITDTITSAGNASFGMAPGGFPGGERPEGMDQFPEGMERPEGMPEPSEGMERPEGMPEPPEGMERPEGMPEPPEGMERPEGMPESPEGTNLPEGEASPEGDD